MKLDFIALDRLSIGTSNMRYAKRAPDVADLLPTVRKRGVLQPVLVRVVPAASSERHRAEPAGDSRVGEGRGPCEASRASNAEQHGPCAEG